jgi:beta-glucosidase
VVASEAHIALARLSAQRSIVLLRNEASLLPLDPGMTGRIAVMGRLAAIANLGDGGSSDVHPPYVVTPLDGIRSAFSAATINHHDSDASIAASADVAIVIVGYTREDEGEYLNQEGTGKLTFMFPPMDHPELGQTATLPGYTRHEFVSNRDAAMTPGGDRTSLRLNAVDEALIAAVSAVNERTVVVVMGGSAVAMPWAHTVAGVVMLWYPGMEGGNALADVLTGAVNPSGRLPFAIPVDEAHLVHFDRDATAETYGLLHGQWHLDATGRRAAFPFGFGLSYTTFALRDTEWDGAAAHVTVANTGNVDGAAVVQLYLGVDSSKVDRPHRRLAGFRRVEVAAGASVRITVVADVGALRVRVNGAWVVEDAPLRIEVGLDASSCLRVSTG